MLPRAHWKGFLKLSLVSCPIALYPAIAKNERISFRQINSRTGNRLRQQLLDAVTGEVVPSGDKARGYEVGENHFLSVSASDLEAAEQEARRRPYSSPAPVPAQGQLAPGVASTRSPRTSTLSRKTGADVDQEAEAPRADSPPIAADLGEPPPRPIENNRTIEIDRFIPRAQIDTRYLDAPYYVVPRDHIGEEAFAVIRDAMRRKDVFGMGRVVLARRERPIILEPMAEGIRGTTLRYNHEIREDDEYFASIPSLRLPQDLLRVAEHIVETKMTDFSPTFLEDRYRTVLISKLKEKNSQRPRKPAPSKPPAENVINLMDVLKRSLASERSTTGSSKRGASARRTAGVKSASSKSARRATNRAS